MFPDQNWKILQVDMLLCMLKQHTPFLVFMLTSHFVSQGEAMGGTEKYTLRK
jgi:hypothetical protein